MVFLLVFICDMEVIRIERALVDLEAGFICDPVTVSQRRCSRMRVSGHKDRHLLAENVEGKKPSRVWGLCVCGRRRPCAGI